MPDLVALVPVYIPSPSLPDLIDELAASGLYSAIIVVDDGNGARYSEFFQDLQKPGINILTHIANLGKGAALKTGLSHALQRWPECKGIITFDADGQHCIEDIKAVSAAFLASPGDLWLGTREFDRNTPLRSAFGNRLTKAVILLFCGIAIEDTQTGLRCIPMGFIPEVIKISSNRYEFELEMLLLAKRRRIPIRQLGIATIYNDNNASSHFHPLIDSIRIYLVFFKFGAVSILSACLDYAIFAICIACGLGIATSLIICRLISASFNFACNKNIVFDSKTGLRHSALLYALLAAFSCCLSWIGIELLLLTGMSVLMAKLLIETLLFFLNFIIQREFIFGRK